MGDVEEELVAPEAEAKVEGGFFGLSIPNIDDEPDFYIEDGIKYHDCLCCHIPEMAHNIIKFCLFGFNVLFWIIAFVLIVLGIWAMLVNQDYGSALSSMMNPSLICLVLGALLFCLTFCGCLGALRENTILLKTFVIAMAVGLLIQLGLVIYSFAFQSLLQGQLNTFFRGAIKNYYDDIDMQNAMDLMQHSFQCCGGEDVNDWDSNMYFACDSKSVSKCGVPYSCCKGFGTLTNNTQCGFGLRTSGTRYDPVLMKSVYTAGCTDVIVVWVQDNLRTVAIVLILFIVPQVISMFLAVTFMNQVEDEIEFWKMEQEAKERNERRIQEQKAKYGHIDQ